jgi:acyl carrier protein
MQCGPGEVLENIRDTLVALIDADPARIVPNARWEDFGADRFDVFAVLKAIQNHFGIKIPDDDAFEMEKVADLITFVVAHRT